MASDELRKRLEALNGGPLATTPAPLEPALDSTPAESRNSVRAIVTELPRRSCDSALANSVTLHAGGEARELSDGRSYHYIETCLASDGRMDSEITAGVCRVLESVAFRDHLRRPTMAAASEAVFLDLETLGLHGEPLFLVGLLTLKSDGTAACVQLLARDLHEETAVLDRCASYLRGTKLLLTYNGKSFDVPFLKARYEAHGLRCPRIPTHVDLLNEARIRYRRKFKDCRLQTLERHLCGRARTGDVPGSRIPAVYRKCIETGNAEPLANILLHNRLDLATTAELVYHFWGH